MTTCISVWLDKKVIIKHYANHIGVCERYGCDMTFRSGTNAWRGNSYINLFMTNATGWEIKEISISKEFEDILIETLGVKKIKSKKKKEKVVKKWLKGNSK